MRNDFFYRIIHIFFEHEKFAVNLFVLESEVLIFLVIFSTIKEYFVGVLKQICNFASIEVDEAYYKICVYNFLL